MRVARGVPFRPCCLTSVEVDSSCIVSGNFEAESVVVADRHAATKLLVVVAAVQFQ